MISHKSADTSCPIKPLIGEYARLIEAYELAVHKSAKSARQEKATQRVWNQMEAMRALFATMRAQSIEGAMLQAALCNAEADLTNATDGTTEEDEQSLRNICNMSFSILNALETITEVRLPKTVRNYLASEDLNPVEILEHAATD